MAYSRKSGHACSKTKKRQGISVKGHNYEFLLLNFPNINEIQHPHKRHVVLKVFTENKLFCFSKRALRFSKGIEKQNNLQ